MKKLCLVVALMLGFGFGQVQAHPEHDNYQINGRAASSIAMRTVQQLTIKELGFEVKRLEEAWKNVSIEHMTVEAYKVDHYVVKATEPESAKTVFLKILKTGQVVQVSESLKL